jgi:hypothetical protein
VFLSPFENVEVNNAFVSWFSMAHLSDFVNHPDSVGVYMIRYEDIRGFYKYLLEK